jgi:hypothetical protein
MSRIVKVCPTTIIKFVTSLLTFYEPSCPRIFDGQIFSPYQFACCRHEEMVTLLLFSIHSLNCVSLSNPTQALLAPIRSRECLLSIKVIHSFSSSYFCLCVSVKCVHFSVLLELRRFVPVGATGPALVGRAIYCMGKSLLHTGFSSKYRTFGD